MPRPSQTESERAQIRQRIIDAARTLFDETGIEGVSMRAIGRRVGLTAAALYAYFPSKSDLLKGIWEDAKADIERRLREISSATPDPLQAIRALGATYADFCLEDPVRFRVLFLWSSDEIRGDAQHPEEHGPYLVLRERVQQAIDQGLAPGHDDADLLAQIFWSAIHGVVSLQITCTDFSFQPAPLLVDTMLTTIAAGVLAGPGKV